jgi:pimeloyl-ACP methyl ester carboxylesterase
MNRRLLAIVIFASCFAMAQPAPRIIDLTAPDGTRLKGTFYAASTNKPAPAVMLLHMCNTDRRSWSWVAEQLSAAGISALTMDNRGFGESGGPRAENASPEVQQQVAAKWPSDFDTEFAWLLKQPNVDKNRIGAGGGSCGVNNAVKLASRHPEIRSLVLLAGGTDSLGINYLRNNAWIPLFTAAAADDEYDREAPQLMQWFAELTGNPRNKFVGFENGRHGTEIFGVHPELPKQIVAFYRETLQKNPANSTAFTPRKTAASEFWAAANQLGGGERAVQIFRDARKRDPNAVVCPEEILNLLAYQRLQAAGIKVGGASLPTAAASSSASPEEIAQTKADTLQLFKLNAEAHPSSANAQDSLADGYLVNGQTAEALAAEQRCLDLLPNDNTQPEQFREQFRIQLRQAAEAKIAKLKSSPASEY